jgi:phage baseplate assembly protein W
LAFGFSPIIPLQKSTEDGYYALTKTIAANTKQNLKNVLLTSPGERVMDPIFGAGLRNYLFGNQYDTIEADITYRVEDQVDRYLPFVKIDNIEFKRDTPLYAQSDKTQRLDLAIFYSVETFNFSDMLAITKIQFI